MSNLIISNIDSIIGYINKLPSDSYVGNVDLLVSNLIKARNCISINQSVANVIHELNSHILDNMNLAINSIQKDIREIKDKFHSIFQLNCEGSSKLGSAGEHYVLDYLRKNCSGSIQKVNKETGRADILYTSGKLQCCIEVKNKEKIVKDDIDKFIRDIDNQKKARGINCALFISIKSNDFNYINRIGDRTYKEDRGNISLKYHHDVPTLYVYTSHVFGAHIIRDSLEVLLNIVNNSKNDNTYNLNYINELKNDNREIVANLSNLIDEKIVLEKCVIEYKIEIEKSQETIEILKKKLEMVKEKCNEEYRNEIEKIQEITKEKCIRYENEIDEMKKELSKYENRCNCLDNLLFIKNDCIKLLKYNLSLTKYDCADDYMYNTCNTM